MSRRFVLSGGRAGTFPPVLPLPAAAVLLALLLLTATAPTLSHASEHGSASSKEGGITFSTFSTFSTSIDNPLASTSSSLPCNTTLLNALSAYYDVAVACLAVANNASNPAAPSLCSPLAPGPLCACSACQPAFDDLIRTYSALKQSTSCDSILSTSNYSLPIARTAIILQTWTCFLSRTNCSNPLLSPLCAPQDGSASLFMRPAGQATVSLCLSAITTSCQSDPTQPFCGSRCVNGVCYTASVNTTVAPAKLVSIYDLMCSKTSPFASDIVANYGYSSYSVDLATMTYNATTGNFSYSNPYNIYPEFTDWGKPPVVFIQKQCTANNTDIAMLGSVSTCRPGLYCPIAQGHVSNIMYCPNGYYCPNPFQPPIQCPSGYFCPQGITEPVPCIFLDVCPAGAKNHISLAGLVFLAIMLLLATVVFYVYRSYERLGWKRYADKLARGAISKSAMVMSPPELEMNISFDGIVVQVKPPRSLLDTLFHNKSKQALASKTIMHNVSGSFKSGRVCGVMGPSGAGKTTIISAVLGKISRSSGTVSLNGRPEELHRYQRIIGYTPQEDVMLPMLTVGEVLTQSARLRLPRSWTHEQIAQQVDAVVSILGLQDVRNSLIGDEVSRGISGGQRKRVNIAMELVSNPAMMVLDEPTTGLDSTSAWEVAKCLKEIANNGRTVVAVIHQPRFEVFQLLDDVLLLGKGGYTTYMGPTSQILPYFASIGFVPSRPMNPADFLIDILAGKVPRQGHPNFHPNDLGTIWTQSNSFLTSNAGQESGEPSLVGAGVSREDSATVAVPRASPSAQLYAPSKSEVRETPSGFSQFRVFAERALLQRYRTPAFSVLYVAIHMVVGAALGAGFLQGAALYLPPLPNWIADFCPPAISSYCQNLPIFNLGIFASSFFLSVAMGSAAIVVAVNTFGSERAVYWREASWGTNRAAYTLAKQLVDLPWMFVGTFAFSAVLAPMLKPISNFDRFLAIVFLTEFASYGLGYIVSVLVAKESSVVVGTVAVFAFSVLSGLSPRLRVIQESYSVGRVLWDISFARYAAEALYISEARLYTADTSIFREPVLRSLDYLGYNVDNLAFDLGILTVLGVAFRGISYVLIAFWDRKKQR